MKTPDTNKNPAVLEGGGASQQRREETQTSDRPSIAAALALLKDTLDWKPAPGDELIGTLEGVVPAVGQFGAGYQLLVRDAEGFPWRVWLTGYLKQQLTAYRATVGSEIGLAFGGKAMGPSGKMYNQYQVVCRAAGGNTAVPLFPVSGGAL